MPILLSTATESNVFSAFQRNPESAYLFQGVGGTGSVPTATSTGPAFAVRFRTATAPVTIKSARMISVSNFFNLSSSRENWDGLVPDEAQGMGYIISYIKSSTASSAKENLGCGYSREAMVDVDAFPLRVRGRK